MGIANYYCTKKKEVCLRFFACPLSLSVLVASCRGAQLTAQSIVGLLKNNEVAACGEGAAGRSLPRHCRLGSTSSLFFRSFAAHIPGGSICFFTSSQSGEETCAFTCPVKWSKQGTWAFSVGDFFTCTNKIRQDEVLGPVSQGGNSR